MITRPIKRNPVLPPWTKVSAGIPKVSNIQEGMVALDYLDRKIAVQNENILVLIKKISEGSFLIPTFQRLFVWNPEDIRALWDSIYHCYPIGGILYWETDIKLHIHRKIGGFFIPMEEETESSVFAYILDGQQRITSLQISFWGGSGKVKEAYDFDFTVYFDLKNSMFFFENEYYRHRRDVDIDLLLRLKDVPDLPIDYVGCLTGTSANIENSFRQLKYIFSNYTVPLFRLEGFDLSSVCKVFERINQTGTRLSHTDILIARGFRNSDVVLEEDFPIRQIK
jgi:hypothetical protein